MRAVSERCSLLPIIGRHGGLQAAANGGACEMQGEAATACDSS
jgi:hypothetical protein